tara:strand:+ start:1329 stop:1748 length:420 start_codon:yes stop_codon:yes gene_type:complete
MSWYNPLSWGEKAADNVLHKKNGLAVQFGGFVNNLHYSDAEKAGNNLKLTDFALKRLSLLEPFKIVQRIIAATTLFMWVFVGLNLCVSIWVNAIYGIDARTDFMALAMSDYIFWPVICVFTLYCGGGVARYFRNDKKKD